MTPFTPDTDPPEATQPTVVLPGRHRREPPARRLARVVLPSLIAIGAVAGLISVLLVTRGPSGKGTPTVFPGSKLAASPSPSEPAAAPTASTHSPTPSRTPTSPTRPPLVVLNNSRIPGLAARAAARFQAGGWQVASVGNLQGRIMATTVYYAPGSRSAASALAAQFPSITRVEPRLPGLPTGPLVVVITRYFAG